MSIFKKCSCSQNATILKIVDEELKRERDEAKRERDEAKEKRTKQKKDLLDAGHHVKRVPALVEMPFLLDKPKGRLLVEEWVRGKESYSIEIHREIRLENGLLINNPKYFEFNVIENAYWTCDGLGCAGQKFNEQPPHKEIYDEE